MTNPTPAAAPDPPRWLAELMANPLSPLQSFSSDTPATLFARLPMSMFTPLEATNAFRAVAATGVPADGRAVAVGGRTGG